MEMTGHMLHSFLDPSPYLLAYRPTYICTCLHSYLPIYEPMSLPTLPPPSPCTGIFVFHSGSVIARGRSEEVPTIVVGDTESKVAKVWSLACARRGLCRRCRRRREQSSKGLELGFCKERTVQA